MMEPAQEWKTRPRYDDYGPRGRLDGHHGKAADKPCGNCGQAANYQAKHGASLSAQGLDVRHRSGGMVNGRSLGNIDAAVLGSASVWEEIDIVIVSGGREAAAKSKAHP